MIDIRGIDKAALLAALHAATSPLGIGALIDRGPLTKDDAQKLLDENPAARFDYVRGRPLKVNLSGDTLDPRLYDRDAGAGEAERAVSALRRLAGATP